MRIPVIRIENVSQFEKETSSSSNSTSSGEGRSRPDKDTPKSQPIKRKSPEKIPYFLDEKRENDRIRRCIRSREGYRSRHCLCVLCPQHSIENVSQFEKETSKGSPIEMNENNRAVSSSSSSSSPEKIPYFQDEKRENERIRRVCGSRRSRSLSRDRRRPRNRSRTRSPSPSYSRRYRSSYNDRRPSSREGYRSRHHRSDYSRSRSRSRERRRRNESNEFNEGRPSAMPPATQFIPIPVPGMPPAWGPPMMPPQPRFPCMMRPPISIPPPVPLMRRLLRPPRYFMPPQPIFPFRMRPPNNP